MSPTSAAELGLRFRTVADMFKDRASAAKAAGISVKQLDRYMRGENEPGLLASTQICAAAGVNLNWLTTGVGEMMLDAKAMARRMMAEDQAEYGPAPSGFVLIPRYDVRASAGPGALNDESNIKDYLAFREDWIRVDLGTSPKEVLCMNAIGDSMEPTIRTADVLLVDRAVTRIADEAIYVVAIEEALLLKRVQPLLGGVVLRSDNAAYGPVTLNAGEADRLRVFGRVRWYGRVI